MKLSLFALLVANSVAEKGETVTHGKVTMLKSEVPKDAPPYWPWVSVEDFFQNSGLATSDLKSTAEQKCTSSRDYSTVYQISDGTNDRCFVAIHPPSITEAAPILFFAHGSGGSAFRCGDEGTDMENKAWNDLAVANNFIFVCGEAVQSEAINNITGAPMHGGIWAIPEVFNETSGRNCNPEDSIENKYMNAIYAKMAEEPNRYDLSRTFIHGCSEGSAFTQWHGVCRHLAAPENVTAFATHSTGLKVKGDGNTFPPCHSDPTYTWGECPTCKYWPTVPGKFDGLKACIFDNTEDPRPQDPYFYRSSEQMVQYYKDNGTRYEQHFGSGGHCVQHSFQAIATCMDDGTGRLLNPSNGSSPSPSPSPSPSSCTDTAPDTNYTCQQQKNFGKCSKPWMDGYCCKTCFNCDSKCSN